MFAVGHVALGYLLGKITSKLTETEIKIPVLLALTILPDIDLLMPGIRHRGPTHSMIVIVLSSLPFLIVYGKTVIPYIIAIVQHSLIGDYLTGGGIQLFWPMNQKWYGLGTCPSSSINIAMEWISCVASLALMTKMGDLRELLKPHPLNLILLIPISSIYSPMFLGFPIQVPNNLIIPHLTYLALFALSILIDLKKLMGKR